MVEDDPLTKTVDIDQLLLFKKLKPLAPKHQATLARVAALDVSGFSEMEVRSAVIDPLVKILGYDFGTDFSPKLEHRVTFLGRHIFPDYQVALWKENFWLIEAKKPGPDKPAFGYEELSQAIEYSVHPSINAALVVLCDGVKLEIFDREASVDAPMFRIDIKHLAKDFDKVRAILEPMQVWFFQKRRVARIIDKVFDKEFNMNRVEEFSRLVQDRLRGKQQTVLENFRKAPKPDEDADLRFVAEATPMDIVELFFFFEYRIPVTNAVNRRLAALSQLNSFQVMHRIFPDAPRDANDVYMAQALAYLMRLGESSANTWWMPAWLTKESADKKDMEAATKYLLRQCLTYFENDEAHRIVLLAANAFRRIAKILAIATDAVRSTGATMHALARFELPEMSWSQYLASPEGQLITFMDANAVTAIKQFVRRHSGENHTFKMESARHELRGYWAVERKMLESIGNYAKLGRERSLGEMRMTEWSGVTYDYLGHLTLCFVKQFPKWQDYALANHRPLIEKLSALGSWSARKLLAIPDDADVAPLGDDEIAQRFFFGDVDMLKTLRAHYRGISATPIRG